MSVYSLIKRPLIQLYGAAMAYAYETIEDDNFPVI